MKNSKLQLKDSNYPFSFSESSYESYVFSHLYRLYIFLEEEKTPYAFFGGVAVAGYSGHLSRNLHDLDLIIPKGEEVGFVSYLSSQGFHEHTRKKSKQADFRKFLFEDDRYQMIVSIFPGKFTLIDLEDENMRHIGTYDFTPALERRTIRLIHALGGQGAVPVVVIPIEDLIITKLWPTFEPKSILDLILLLGSDAASSLDFSYIANRLKQTDRIRLITLQTLKRFLTAYNDNKCLWSKGLPKKGAIKAQVQSLINALGSTNVSELVQ
jgi:hypothetical protein